jgi:hypothetical protein
MSKGVIYVIRNDCFNFLPNCVKIGFTTNLEQRKKDYITSYPSDCEWVYVSPEVDYIKTRERLIFKKLEEHRCRLNREFFCCDLSIIISTIEDTLKLSYKAMCESLNIKSYKLEYDKFFKSILKKTEKGKYEKVCLNILYTSFKVWCKAKGVRKLPPFEEFYEKVEDKYKVKESKDGFEYLEKVIFNI